MLRRGQGASGRAAELRETVILNDYQRQSGGETPAGKAGVRAAVAAPLMYEGRLLGTLSVNSYDPNKRFTHEDAETIELLAGVAAAQLVGLERAQLLASTFAARELAHRLNNSLAIVVGTLELIQQQASLPSHLREMLSDSGAALDTATECVTQLQRLVRFETKDTPVGLALDLERSVAPES